MTAFPTLVDLLTVAERRQTDEWLRMPELAEALHRERRRYHMAFIDHDEFVARTGPLVAMWEKALEGWVDARREVESVARACDGLLR